jgi:hypothetical protein
MRITTPLVAALAIISVCCGGSMFAETSALEKAGNTDGVSYRFECLYSPDDYHYRCRLSPDAVLQKDYDASIKYGHCRGESTNSLSFTQGLGLELRIAAIDSSRKGAVSLRIEMTYRSVCRWNTVVFMGEEIQMPVFRHIEYGGRLPLTLGDWFDMSTLAGTDVGLFRVRVVEAERLGGEKTDP